jgi:hypothetical protein
MLADVKSGQIYIVRYDQVNAILLNDFSSNTAMWKSKARSSHGNNSELTSWLRTCKRWVRSSN